MNIYTENKRKADWSSRIIVISLLAVTILCVCSLLSILLIAQSSDNSSNSDSEIKSETVSETLDEKTDSISTKSSVLQQAEDDISSEENELVKEEEVSDVPDSSSASGQTSTPKPTDTVHPTKTPPSDIGNDVIVGDIRWQILDALNMGNTLVSTNPFIDNVTTSGNFIQVRFEIENLSQELSQFGGVNLEDVQGRSFQRSDDFGLYSFTPDDESCHLLDYLNPNVPIICTIFFEVAVDSEGLKIKVGDFDLFSSEEKLIYLGLNMSAISTPNVIIGSREHPYKLGEEVSLKSESNIDYTLLITDVVRGDDAWTMLQQENRFNDPPPEAMEWLLVKIKVHYSGEESGLLEVDESDFGVLTNNRLLDYFDVPSAVIPEPKLDDVKLFSGGEFIGWTYWTVYTDDPSPMLNMGPIFFALSE